AKRNECLRQLARRVHDGRILQRPIALSAPRAALRRRVAPLPSLSAFRTGSAPAAGFPAVSAAAALPPLFSLPPLRLTARWLGHRPLGPLVRLRRHLQRFHTQTAR